MITCKICTVTYNTDERKPLTLWCGHTYCAECVDKMIKDPIVQTRRPPALLCPNRCDRTVPYPDINKMKINWEVLDMVEYASTKGDTKCC